jgi:hypothetical protein
MVHVAGGEEGSTRHDDDGRPAPSGAPRYWRDDGAYVFRVPSDKVIAFAKSPHGSTTLRR